MKKLFLTGALLTVWAVVALAATACYVNTALDCPSTAGGCTLDTAGSTYPSIIGGSPGEDSYYSDNKGHCKYDCSGGVAYYYVGGFITGNACPTGGGGGSTGVPAPPQS